MRVNRVVSRAVAVSVILTCMLLVVVVVTLISIVIVAIDRKVGWAVMNVWRTGE